MTTICFITISLYRRIENESHYYFDSSLKISSFLKKNNYSPLKRGLLAKRNRDAEVDFDAGSDAAAAGERYSGGGCNHTCFCRGAIVA
jgi:hypothetical protein